MDKIITDNSKVNENLLNEVNAVNKQNKELVVKNIDLQEQLLIQRVSNRRKLLIGLLTKLENGGGSKFINKEEIVTDYLKDNS
tara:strand:- start:48 stop:296 length:249 start_codon:yes stop_codon:yes gene_type:complete